MILEFDIHGYWQVGTGRGAGPNADAVAFRDGSGLPCVPGRQVKGLLREAVELAERCKAIKSGSAKAWFGTSLPDALPDAAFEPDAREENLEAMRFNTLSGTLFVGSAVLGRGRAEADRWRRWASTNASRVAELFRPFASTKIEDSGVVAEASLRTIEVVVPMKLYAEVTGAGGAWEKDLPKALCLVDGVGGHRSRGFGRVTVREVKP